MKKILLSFDNIITRTWQVCAIAMGLFHIYTAVFGILTPMLQRMAHLSFALVIAFLASSKKDNKKKIFLQILDILLSLVAIAVMVYVAANYMDLVYRQGNPIPTDFFFGFSIIVLILEGSRRSLGWSLPIIAFVFLLYAYAGPYMPGLLAHRGYNTRRIVSHLFISSEGIFGIPLGVSSTYIAIFILFASFLKASGVGDFFNDMALGMAGHKTGGPAKVAVITSAFFGMLSGAATANVASTGSFTIPMMKKRGYPPAFAGAVEAVASTGGILMPPIMGAAAFIMIEFTGTSYSKIIVAAAIPAILYFVSVFFQVGFVAKNLGLSGLPKEQLPNPWATLKKSGYLIFPVFVLLFFLFYLDASPMRAGIFSLFATIAVSLFSKKNRLIKLDRLANALIEGIRNAVPVAIACACAGIVVGITTLTGVGLTLSSLIIKASGGSLMIALILTMITSIILGMGLPPSACYIVLAVMVAPALVEMGVPLLAAHMFIFYFGSLAVITLPVALASYTAAALAGSKPFETAYRALWLALAAFIVPYMFVYGPSLLAIGTPLRIFTSFLTAVIGVVCLASALQGRTFIRIGVVFRIAMAAAALLLIRPGMKTDIFGVGLAAAIIIIQKVKQRIEIVKNRKQSTSSKGEEKQ